MVIKMLFELSLIWASETEYMYASVEVEFILGTGRAFWVYVREDDMRFCGHDFPVLVKSTFPAVVYIHKKIRVYIFCLWLRYSACNWI